MLSIFIIWILSAKNTVFHNIIAWRMTTNEKVYPKLATRMGSQFAGVPCMGSNYRVPCKLQAGSPERGRLNPLIARGKGVRREAESEGSPRRIPGLTNRNLMRGYEPGQVCRRRRNPFNQGAKEYIRQVWDESYCSYRGRSTGKSAEFACDRNRQPSPRGVADPVEVSRGHSNPQFAVDIRPWDEGPNTDL
jgi:hypothetical protein